MVRIFLGLYADELQIGVCFYRNLYLSEKTTRLANSKTYKLKNLQTYKPKNL